MKHLGRKTAFFQTNSYLKKFVCTKQPGAKKNGFKYIEEGEGPVLLALHGLSEP